jgi:hypothetical protein
MIDKTIPHYRIIEKLGGRGIAVVYPALQGSSRSSDFNPSAELESRGGRRPILRLKTAKAALHTTQTGLSPRASPKMGRQHFECAQD